MITKRCGKCETWKPRTLEYWHADRGKKDGLHAHCKSCASAYKKVLYEANSESEKARCKARYAANPERIKARVKAYREANPEATKAQFKAWREANLERKKAANKAWFDANPEKTKAINARSRAKRRANLAQVPTGKFDRIHLKRDLFESQLGRCKYCSEHFTIDTLTLDHIEPLAKKGPDLPCNITLACKHCNSSKGDRTPGQWLSALPEARRPNYPGLVALFDHM